MRTPLAEPEEECWSPGVVANGRADRSTKIRQKSKDMRCWNASAERSGDGGLQTPDTKGDVALRFQSRPNE
jgi:hypothetical protein